jgi:DNA polymerase III subunit delta'
MAFRDFPAQEQGIELLQRSLERGRLGHGYLFTGHDLDELEGLARTLAKTLNCQQPVVRGGVPVDCCDACLPCRKIQNDNYPDVFWVRPESKTRLIKIGQFVRRPDSPARVLLDVVNFKPTESQYKIGIIVGADRMNEQAANAFLKTLEEPPGNSILILLTTEPQRLLETILSRCLRLNFAGGVLGQVAATHRPWLEQFAGVAAKEQKTLIGRYLLLDVLLARLTELKNHIQESLSARSPLEQHPDAEQSLRDQWEDELAAAIEAEYRRQRGDLLAVVHSWLRDVWLLALQSSAPGQPVARVDTGTDLAVFPGLDATRTVAGRISPEEATANLESFESLQRCLFTNVQEALALEVGLLKLKL